MRSFWMIIRSWSPLVWVQLGCLLCAANFAGEGAIIVFFAMGCLITCLPVSWDAFEALACGRVIWCVFASEPLDSTFCGGGENRTIRHSAITGAYSLSVEPQFSWASEPRWQKAVAAMQEAEESRVRCEFKTLRRMRLYLQILCTYIYYIHINGCFLKWYPKTIASPHQSR